MTDIDDRIHAGLDADDRAFLEGLQEEPGVFRLLGDTFRGPNSWLSWLVNALILVASGLGIWAIIEFVQASETQAMIRWAAFGWAAWTVQIALKQWLWDRMNMLSLLREVKRLQVLVAARD